MISKQDAYKIWLCSQWSAMLMLGCAIVSASYLSLFWAVPSDKLIGVAIFQTIGFGTFCLIYYLVYWYMQHKFGFKYEVPE